jgi:hypothetical protein
MGGSISIEGLHGSMPWVLGTELGELILTLRKRLVILNSDLNLRRTLCGRTRKTLASA